MDSYGNVYFKASVQGGSTITSGTLSVSQYAVNYIPSVNIILPVTGSLYMVNTPVFFSQVSSDAHANITNYNWDLGDGYVVSGNTSGTHYYQTAGQKTITLTVTDEKGSIAKDQVSIFVLGAGANGLYPFISQPAYQGVVLSNSLTAPYDAQGSYVLNITSSGQCVSNIVCAAGQCPTAINGQQTGCQSPTFTSTAQPYANALFNWTFEDGTTWVPSVIGYGYLSGNQAFASVGQKIAELTLGYAGYSASATKSFTVLNQRQCSSDGATWYQVQNGKIIASMPTIGAGANPSTCAGLDGQPGTADDCCPAGQMCTSNGCVFDTNPNATCSDYTTASSCNADPSQRVQNSPLWNFYGCGTIVNGTVVTCNCSWIQAQNGSSNCQFYTNRQNADLTGAVSSCTYSTTSGACTNGYQQVYITATGADPSCQNSTQTLPCGKPVIELPFVNGVTMIGAVVLIIMIYLFYHYSKKPRRR